MDIIERAKNLHNSILCIDAHDHIMLDIEKRRARGERAVFSNYYAKKARAGGVNVICVCVGGDSPNLCSHSDLLLWGTLRIMNMVLTEAEESADTIAVCRTYDDIVNTVNSGKIAIIMSLEGSRPLEGKPNLDTQDTLEMLYRMGLRQVQMADMGRDRACDGVSAYRTKSRLTPFGVEMVKTLNRLGVVIDTAHMNDAGFDDVIEITTDPIIDSHSSCAALAEYAHNISDERIKKLSKNGGVLCISLYDLSIGGNGIIESGYRPTVDDMIRHIDHVVEVGGIDMVGLGSDHMPYDMYGNYKAIDHCFYPIPGYMEGTVWLGVRQSYYVDGIDDITGWGLITEGLVKHGYSDEDIAKIMGGNLMRVYKQVLK